MPPALEAVDAKNLTETATSVLCGKDSIASLAGGFLIAVMGLVLELLGEGGSILTVPTLVYVLGIEAHAPISFSLILVGSAAIPAALLHQ